jgi:Zn-dependent protease
MIDPNELLQGCLLYLILLASVCLREWAQALTADRLGDSTPRLDGRTSLNPANHIDPLGTVIFPIIFIFFLGSPAPFGWGRHLYMNADHFRKPARDEIIARLAGPGCSFLLALGAAILGGLTSQSIPGFFELMFMVIGINTTLIIINLLPVPPLDGGYILKSLTGMSEQQFINLARFCFIILLGIFLFPPTARVVQVGFALLNQLFISVMYQSANLVGG